MENIKQQVVIIGDMYQRYRIALCTKICSIYKGRKEDFIMEKFLKDYVQMIAEASELELNNSQIKRIVNNLRENEELWDMFDSYVNDEIDEEVM